MDALPEQIELIERLQILGAVIPADDHDNPSSEMFESFNNAVEYIHKWKHLLP